MSFYVSNSESVIQQFKDNPLEAMRLRKMSFLENIFSGKYVFLGSDGSNWGKDKALDDFKNPNY